MSKPVWSRNSAEHKQPVLLALRGVERLFRARALRTRNPDFISAGAWDLRRLDQQNLDGDYAVTIMDPHQGDHGWVAVFRDGEDDARAYVKWGDEREGENELWKLTAPSIIEENDIGLVLHP